jgi:hypothetical protein
MMDGDDLVRRLREEIVVFGRPTIRRNPDGPEAANRIEELEAALRDISHMHDGNPSPAMADMPDVDYARFVLGEARRVARAALGEKKDG